jgi:hypothetical protein
MLVLTRKASTVLPANSGACIFPFGRSQQFELLSTDGIIPDVGRITGGPTPES